MPISLTRNDTKRDLKLRIRQNQPLHKRLVLHPFSVMIILCAAVFIVGWTFKVLADDYVVTAQVDAAPLESGALITSPVDGATLTSSTVTVSGTCPVDSYVNLYRNGAFSGTAWCENNSFSILTQLSSGMNVLTAQDYNITNNPGPSSPSVTVTYQPPVTPSVPSTGLSSSSSPTTSSSASSGRTPSSQSSVSSTPAASAAPPLLTSSFSFTSFPLSTPYVWQLSLGGGSAPYKVKTNWGDNTTSNQTVNHSGTFTIKHLYHKAGYYAVVVRTIDKAGSETVLQISALVKLGKSSANVFSPPGTTSCNATSCTSSSNPFSFLTNAPEWLLVAWPSLLIVLLMLASYYLGEKQEYFRLYKRHHV